MKYILKIDEVDGKAVLSEYVDEQGGLWYYAKTSNNRIGKVSKAWITENKDDILNLEVLKGNIVKATEYKKEEAKEIQEVVEEKPPVKKEVTEEIVKEEEPVKVEKVVEQPKKRVGLFKRAEAPKKIKEEVVVVLTEDEQKYIDTFVSLCFRLKEKGFTVMVGPQNKIDSLMVDDEDGLAQIFSINMLHTFDIPDFLDRLFKISNQCDTNKIVFEFIKSKVKTQNDIDLLRRKIKVVDNLKEKLKSISQILVDFEKDSDYKNLNVDFDKMSKLCELKEKLKW